MARKNIAAGNWKMNLDAKESEKLAFEVTEAFRAGTNWNCELVLGPAMVNLRLVAGVISEVEGIHLAAQNVHKAPSGAYTGETSVDMLKGVGCSHVIIGHSERRQFFQETNESCAEKLSAVIDGGLTAIYCVGETLFERENGLTEEVVIRQIKEGCFHIPASDFGQVVIAYEPVWAIGTGKTASPAQAQEVHVFIRGLLKEKYGQDIAYDTSILYGGSVKPGNARELFMQADIDGGLVGGASLKASDFIAIAESF